MRQIKNEDLAHEGEAARADINKWITERTGGIFKDLTPEKVMPMSTYWPMASWLEPFDSFQTKNPSFSAMKEKASQSLLWLITSAEVSITKLDLPLWNTTISLTHQATLRCWYFSRAKKMACGAWRRFIIPVHSTTISWLLKRILILALPSFESRSVWLWNAFSENPSEEYFDETTSELSGMVTMPAVHVSLDFHNFFIGNESNGSSIAARFYWLRVWLQMWMKRSCRCCYLRTCYSITQCG